MSSKLHQLVRCNCSFSRGAPGELVELRVKADVVCWQVKLCDPHLSALEVRYDEALYKSTNFTTFLVVVYSGSNSSNSVDSEF